MIKWKIIITDRFLKVKIMNKLDRKAHSTKI